MGNDATTLWATVSSGHITCVSCVWCFSLPSTLFRSSNYYNPPHVLAYHDIVCGHGIAFCDVIDCVAGYSGIVCCYVLNRLPCLLIHMRNLSLLLLAYNDVSSPANYTNPLCDTIGAWRFTGLVLLVHWMTVGARNSLACVKGLVVKNLR